MLDVGCGRWVGRTRNAWSDVLRCIHKLQATSHEPLSKPPPRPSPKGREVCLVTNRGPQASSRLETTNHKRRNVTTSHKLQATSWFSRFPGRGRTRRPRSGVHAARNARVLSLPFRSPRATRCGPYRRFHHEPRTTYHAPTGRTRGSAPTREIAICWCFVILAKRTTVTSAKLSTVIPANRASRLARAGT